MTNNLDLTIVSSIFILKDTLTHILSFIPSNLVKYTYINKLFNETVREILIRRYRGYSLNASQLFTVASCREWMAKFMYINTIKNFGIKRVILHSLTPPALIITNNHLPYLREAELCGLNKKKDKYVINLPTGRGVKKIRNTCLLIIEITQERRINNFIRKYNDWSVVLYTEAKELDLSNAKRVIHISHNHIKKPNLKFVSKKALTVASIILPTILWKVITPQTSWESGDWNETLQRLISFEEPGSSILVHGFDNTTLRLLFPKERVVDTIKKFEKPRRRKKTILELVDYSHMYQPITLIALLRSTIESRNIIKFLSHESPIRLFFLCEEDLGKTIQNFLAEANDKQLSQESRQLACENLQSEPHSQSSFLNEELSLDSNQWVSS